MCGVWIALEDIAADADPLAWYPGSHRLPVISARDAAIARRATLGDYPAVLALLERRLAEHGLQRREAVIPKGHAFVWAANLAHGGAPIARADATRWSLVVHHHFEGCLYFAPLRSDEGTGDLHVRLPYDIAARRWRWSTADGRIVLPDLAEARSNLALNLLRRPHLS